jgi:folate-binding protein YgfZ
MNTYTIDHRSLEFEKSIENTLQYDNQQLYFCNLPFLNVIKVVGKEAQSFLQGQLTNDVNLIQFDELQANLLCNLKGQIISQIWVGHTEEFFYMICPRDLNAEILGILSKIALLSKVQLIATDSWQVKGLIDVGAATLALTLAEPPPHFIEKPNLFWQYFHLYYHQFSIYPKTCRQFLPHHLQMEQHGWINFKKGCYRGQEIIARMHYLGKSKYQIQTSHYVTPYHISPGNAVYNQNQQKIGELVDFCPIKDQEYLVMLCIKHEEIHKEFYIVSDT